MKVISAKEAKAHFEKYMKLAVSEPVEITSDEETIIMLSKKEYALLEACEDAYWGARAHLAEAKGFADKQEIKKLLKRFFNDEKVLDEICK